MRAGQQAHFTADWADRLQVATIRAQAIVQNIVAHIRLQLFFIKGDDIFELVRKFRTQCGHQFVLYHTQSG